MLYMHPAATRADAIHGVYPSVKDNATPLGLECDLLEGDLKVLFDVM
jgi:hypothetical protein